MRLVEGMIIEKCDLETEYVRLRGGSQWVMHLYKYVNMVKIWEKYNLQIKNLIPKEGN